MAVRVALKLFAPGGRDIGCVGLLNGGFETAEPCILLPRQLAEKALPDFPAGASAISGEAVGGPVGLLAMKEAMRVCVRAADRYGPEVRCRVLVSDTEREVLVSDVAIDALGVRIESFRKGTWRFVNEKKLRRTQMPQRL